MAGGKLTPRQKMINMMYLVLTALLAMNVSKEVLLAFRSIEVGIENSNTVVKSKIDLLSETLKNQAKENEKAVPLLALSEQVTAVSNELIDYIESVKTQLLSDKYAGESEDHPGQVEKLDDIDSPTRLLADKQSPGFMGKELQDKINATEAKYLEILGKVDKITPAEITQIQSSFTLNADDFEKTKDRTQTEWYSQFFQVPATGVMTMLTKIENDVYNTEAIVNEFLLNRVSALDYKFDKLRATVQAPKSYLPGGAQYEANIFLTASSSGIVAETYVGRLDMSKFPKDSLGDLEPFNSATESPFTSEPKLVPNGKYTSGTAVGQNGTQGAIKIANPAGGFDWYPFDISYEGAAPGGFSVSPTKMNVLYIGVDNPLSITLGDAKPGTERVSISQGSISGKGNSWTARVSSPGEANITVAGTTPSGEAAKSQTAKFRVKYIPDPIPTLGGDENLTNNGKGQKGTIKAKGGIVPLLKDFDFEARFTVVSYDFYLTSGGELLPARGNSGPMYSGTVSNLIDRAKPNDLMVFDNIKVQGPDGKTRKIPGMSFQIF